MEQPRAAFQGQGTPRVAVETLRLLIPLPDFIEGCASMSTMTNLAREHKRVSVTQPPALPFVLARGSVGVAHSAWSYQNTIRGQIQ